MSVSSKADALLIEIRALEDENKELREEIAHLRRRQPPQPRKRSRSPPSQQKAAVRDTIQSQTDIYIGNFFATKNDTENFIQSLKAYYDIEAGKVLRLGRGVGARLCLHSNRDQNRFLDNADRIGTEFGLNNMTVFNELCEKRAKH